MSCHNEPDTIQPDVGGQLAVNCEDTQFFSQFFSLLPAAASGRRKSDTLVTRSLGHHKYDLWFLLLQPCLCLGLVPEPLNFHIPILIAWRPEDCEIACLLQTQIKHDLRGVRNWDEKMK